MVDFRALFHYVWLSEGGEMMKRLRGRWPAIILAAAVMIGCGAESEQKYNFFFERAEEAFFAGRYREAVEEYEKAVRVEPENLDAYERLALINDNLLGDKDEAVFYYGEYLKREEKSEKKSQMSRWMRRPSENWLTTR